ncbi:MAG: ATP-binding protein [Actinomycetota bacterium]|nr:ATP-binding protein [Actinomycetota bacterium]
MGSDPDVIAVMEAAVAAAPGNAALRVHLATLLLDAGRAEDALEHATAALATQPDNLDALEIAGAAADAAGLADRAAGYRRLRDALGGAPRTQPAQPAEPAQPVPAAGDDQFDAFLREVLAEADVDVERLSVTLADVGGLDDVKRRLEASFLGPMRNPELRAMYGKSLRGGLLLYGPPGCGKTFIARALAGELGARFVSIGLHDVLDMWLGESERNVHEIFEAARRAAPCVLFFDEVDALGQKRSHLARSAGRNVVVQLLNELDSTRDDNEGVFVLGATNQPWDIDPALRRPGRFDRMVLVLPPDAPARHAIAAYHLAGRPVEGVDLARVAARTDGYSGADIRLLCEAAAEEALADSVRTGRPRPISQADLDRAVKDVRPSTRPWFEVARNHAMFANEGGVYDDLMAYLRKNRLA